MESKVYNQQGKEVGKVKLPEKVFGAPLRSNLVHQVVVSMMGNKRSNTAHAKMRGEVSGTGRKPWKQKGTGRARHGSRRSPIWVGGGVAHGPRNERDYSRKINKKMKTQALYSVLSQKMKDGEVMFVDNINFDKPQTKQAKNVVVTMSKIPELGGLERRKNAAIIALAKRDEVIEKSFRNFGNMEVEQVRNLNPLDILKYKYLIITDPEKSIEIISSRSHGKS